MPILWKKLRDKIILKFFCQAKKNQELIIFSGFSGKPDIRIVGVNIIEMIKMLLYLKWKIFARRHKMGLNLDKLYTFMFFK